LSALGRPSKETIAADQRDLFVGQLAQRLCKQADILSAPRFVPSLDDNAVLLREEIFGLLGFVKSTNRVEPRMARKTFAGAPNIQSVLVVLVVEEREDRGSFWFKKASTASFQSRCRWD
jgi:hypothetical protein